MSLQFIIGNSGSGKTEYLFNHIVKEAAVHPEKDYLVLVPEQFTMQTQRKLVDLSANKAIMNIDVLSFKRLAYRVFDELGMSWDEVLEETGKNLVLRKVAQDKKENLTVLRANMNRVGYISEVKSLLSELMQYNISSAQLLEYMEKDQFPAALKAKLTDVAVMYEGFEEFMQGKYITAEEILTLLIRVAKDSKMLSDSVLAFDEFTGFTPIQNQLLQTIMPMTEDIYVTLTMDEKEDFYHSKGMQELFDMPKKTIEILLKLAQLTGIEVKDPVVLGGAEKKRFAHAPNLAFMEQNLFRPTYKRQLEPVEEIKISSAKTPKEEMIFVAREINRLIREDGLRFREIAVVTGAVEGYGHYVEEVFGRYKIPYFLDKTKEILFHPFIEWIRASLEVVEKDFSYEAIMRWLKCGFWDYEEEQIDMLDNYLVATGIRGKSRWSKRWLTMPRQEKDYDLEILEKLRLEIYEIFEPVFGAFSKEKSTVAEEILALYEMMVKLNIEQKLWAKEDEYLAQDEQVKAKEYGQSYRFVLEILDKYVSILGQEKMNISEFTEILDAGLEAADVAVIPPGYDSVTIGDIERTRLNHIKVLFFIGVNDGIIPKQGNTGGIISQYERELLKEADIALAPGAREQVFIQRFYLYLNLTKPSERLYVSYARVDSEGKSQRRSYLIGVLLRMFPALSVTELEELELTPDYSTKEAAFSYLVHGKKDEAWYVLANYFFTHGQEEEKQELEKLLQASFKHYAPEPISKVVAQALYGRQLEGSVTRLERFAACAYAHFLQYGLKLRERDVNGFAGVDMGNIYHDALENYSRKLAASEYDWFTVPEETRQEFASRSMEEAVAAYPNLNIYSNSEDKHQAARMEHIFEQTVWALTKQVRKGRFVPNDFEISFDEADSLEALEFMLEEGNRLKLNGRIDRLDTCKEDGNLYVKVIDYKSGNTKFDLIKLYQGLQLQLVVYMNAAMELEKKKNPKGEVIPAGMFYYHIDDPVIESEGNLNEEEIRDAILMELRPEGLVNSEEEIYRAMDDEFEGKSQVIPVTLKKDGSISASGSYVASSEEFNVMQEYANTKILRSAKDIYEGNIQVNPYTAGSMESSCSYCPYASVCGFDRKIPGYRYRKLEAVEKSEIIEKMQTENALFEAGE